MIGNQPLSLFDLNRLIKESVEEQFQSYYWTKAETSDVRSNQNGHCYLELIDHDKKNNLVAKTKAIIWSNTFFLLKALFEEKTGQPFQSGIKVLVQVSITYHELYGLSLTIHDIDPAYTLGEKVQARQAIIKQLKEDGVFELNKELALNRFANRIAIISSPTAAGYEDFCNQLANNPYGFVFYTKLFPAIMQGSRSEDSVIDAFERIYDESENFDTVVLIRGGGATSDLSCFDSYLMAACCAQFALPVITGIGHERDETVTDMVAFRKAKTPTAAAEFLIDHLAVAAEIVAEAGATLQEIVKDTINHHTTFLNNAGRNLNLVTGRKLDSVGFFLKTIKTKLEYERKRLVTAAESEMVLYTKLLDAASPEKILERGFTLTMKDGKPVKPNQLEKGDIIETVFANRRSIKSTIK